MTTLATAHLEESDAVMLPNQAQLLRPSPKENPVSFETLSFTTEQILAKDACLSTKLIPILNLVANLLELWQLFPLKFRTASLDKKLLYAQILDSISN